MEILIWLGIVICISQSAMFSGLNLAFFSIPKLRLELEVSRNNPLAYPIAKLREDSNFLLATILWGNVGVNVLLTLLSGSVLTGVTAFLFSTFLITIMGEIIPQAYLSRNAMKAASVLSPVIKFYQVILFPLSKPTAMILDRWLGKEAIKYIPEEDIKALIKFQMDKEEETNISKIESKGIINFLELDKVAIENLGSVIESTSVIQINTENVEVQFPKLNTNEFESFVKKINNASSKWIIITDKNDHPLFVLNSLALAKELNKNKGFNCLLDFCYKPLVYESGQHTFHYVMETLQKELSKVVLVWQENNRRIITNRDALRLILKGIIGE